MEMKKDNSIIVVGDSADMVFYKLFAKINAGIKTIYDGDSEKEKMLGIKNVRAILMNPRNRIIFDKRANFDIRYAVGEFLWNMRGCKESIDMLYYRTFALSDPFNGAYQSRDYGSFLFNYKNGIVDFIEREDGVRNCYDYVVWQYLQKCLQDSINNNDEEEIQCNMIFGENKYSYGENYIGLMFKPYMHDGGNYLNCTISMGNCLLTSSFAYDVFLFSMLHEIMADNLNMKLGTIDFVIDKLIIPEQEYVNIYRGFTGNLTRMLGLSMRDFPEKLKTIETQAIKRATYTNAVCCIYDAEKYLRNNAHIGARFPINEWESIFKKHMHLGTTEYEALIYASLLMGAAQLQGYEKFAYDKIINKLDELKFHNIADIFIGDYHTAGRIKKVKTIYEGVEFMNNIIHARDKYTSICNSDKIPDNLCVLYDAKCMDAAYSPNNLDVQNYMHRLFCVNYRAVFVGSFISYFVLYNILRMEEKTGIKPSINTQDYKKLTDVVCNNPRTIKINICIAVNAQQLEMITFRYADALGGADNVKDINNSYIGICETLAKNNANINICDIMGNRINAIDLNRIREALYG